MKTHEPVCFCLTDPRYQQARLNKADYASSTSDETEGLAVLEKRIRHKPDYRHLSDYWRDRALQREANADIFAGRTERAAELVAQVDRALP